MSKIPEHLLNAKICNKKTCREIEIKNRYMKMIVDLGIDYDGYNDVSHLKKLIDNLVYLAKLGIESNDKTSMYEDDKDSFNILLEKIDK